MSKPLPLGLIASGRMTESPLIRYPSLVSDLGPVVASSRRLASRYANALRAGHPADAKELGGCRLVLVQAPACELPAILSMLVESQISWKSKALALIDDDLDAEALQPMRALRAAVGSVTLAPSRERGVLVIEGDAAAVRVMNQWAAQARMSCIELKPQCKALYGAGLMAANSLLPPVLDGAMRSLRASGLSQLDSRRMLSLVVEMAIRGQRAHGRKAWLSPASMSRRPAVLNQLAALAEVDPVLAAYFQRSLIAILDYVGQDPDWLGDPPPQSQPSPD
ncbi:hypothetical protein [Paludibaculum fermentans]|uniref:hypothetical protein n=1 Tax=Paludibaculum fermentans TaxID=1473598 RepID=UPI003EBFE7D0